MPQIIISGDWHKLVSDWQEVTMSSPWKNLSLQYHLLPSGSVGGAKVQNTANLAQRPSMRANNSDGVCAMTKGADQQSFPSQLI